MTCVQTATAQAMERPGVGPKWKHGDWWEIGWTTCSANNPLIRKHQKLWWRLFVGRSEYLGKMPGAMWKVADTLKDSWSRAKISGTGKWLESWSHNKCVRKPGNAIPLLRSPIKSGYDVFDELNFSQQLDHVSSCRVEGTCWVSHTSKLMWLHFYPKVDTASSLHFITSRECQNTHAVAPLHHNTHSNRFFRQLFKFRHPGVFVDKHRSANDSSWGIQVSQHDQHPSATANSLGIQVPTSSFRADSSSGVSPPTNYLFSRIEKYPVSTSYAPCQT